MWNYCEGSFLSGCMTVVSRLPMTNHLPVKEFEGDVGPVFSRHVGLSQTCRPPTGATLSFPSGCRVHWARRKPVDYGRWTPMNILWKDMICTLHLTLVHGFSMVLASFWGHVSCWCLLRFAKYPFPELRGWKHPEWPAPILGGCLRTARIIYIPHLHISTCGMPSEKLWRFECHECPAVRVEPWPLFRAVLEVIKRGLSIPVTPRPFFWTAWPHHHPKVGWAKLHQESSQRYGWFSENISETTRLTGKCWKTWRFLRGRAAIW